MSFVGNYVSGILVVSVLTVLLENLLPNTHDKKYIRTVIGLAVMLVIASPLSHLTEFRDKLVLPETLIDDSDLSLQNGRKTVAEEFEKRLAETLRQTVWENCGIQTEVGVSVSVNEKDEILGIKDITVFPINEEICRVLSETAGVATEQICEGRQGA